MRILAIETSGRTGSLALLEAEGDAIRVLGSRVLEKGQRIAQLLAPAMQGLLGNQLLGKAGWKPLDIDLVAVVVGPGSFTGLRLGVTTAKMFAYAAGAELVGVNTLDVLAAQVLKPTQPIFTGQIWTVLDAQRNELFVGKYAAPLEKAPLEKVESNSLMTIDDWLAKLTAGDWVNGSILERIGEKIPAEVNVADQLLWVPQAATVGEIAWNQYRAGQRDDPWQMVPIYGRPSAAEEKLASKS